ncbi:50S ribosomal protein L21 [Ruminococcaceae bacterium OttesenSCG-928-I18]|nr:50S ribosomal protein L21 [Ruminococcaceae bacterium OttesenSCG-928-I18]
MYAIIESGGKQYRVEEGDVLFLEKLPANEDDVVVFEDVLAVGDSGKVTVGTPLVSGAKVTGQVLKNGRGKKLNIITYKPKKGSVRRIGHRQPYTKVEITEISGK